jgi:hypothetical protein
LVQIISKKQLIIFIIKPRNLFFIKNNNKSIIN